jgi:hypothetical protein
MEVVAHQTALGQLKWQVEKAVHGAGTLVDGVVEEHVDPAPLIEHLVGHPVDRLAVHEVHLDCQAGPTRRLDLSRGGLEAAGNGHLTVSVARGRRMGAAFALVDGAGRDGDVEAPTGQGQGPAFPDAAAGPGDQGNAAVGSVRHSRSLSPTYIIPAIW